MQPSTASRAPACHHDCMSLYILVCPYYKQHLIVCWPLIFQQEACRRMDQALQIFIEDCTTDDDCTAEMPEDMSPGLLASIAEASGDQT